MIEYLVNMNNIINLTPSTPKRQTHSEIHNYLKCKLLTYLNQKDEDRWSCFKNKTHFIFTQILLETKTQVNWM